MIAPLMKRDSSDDSNSSKPSRSSGLPTRLRGSTSISFLPSLLMPPAFSAPAFKLKEGQLLKSDVKVRDPYSTFPRGTRSFTQETYTALEYGYEEAVDDTVAADISRFFDAEVVAAKLSRRKLLLAHEIRVAGQIFNTGNFTSTNSGTAYTTANLATFDIAEDVQLALDRMISNGESTANTRVVIPYPVWTRARASTKFQNRLRGAGISSDTILNASTQAAAEVFGVSEVLIGRAAYDSAAEGVAFSSSNVWSNAYVWVGNVTESGAGYFGGGAGLAARRPRCARASPRRSRAGRGSSSSPKARACSPWMAAPSCGTSRPG